MEIMEVYKYITSVPHGFLETRFAPTGIETSALVHQKESFSIPYLIIPLLR